MAGAVSNLMVRAGFDGSQLTRGLQQMQSQVRGTNEGVTRSMESLSSSAKTIQNLIHFAYAKIAASIGSIGVSYDAMQESSTVAWTTLLGSQEKAKKQIQDIANFAKNTQFDTEGVDAMAKYLNNAGYEGQKLFDQLNRVADVSGAFNISADNAKEMVRQMSQVDQAQVAYTADLDILQNQGIPIFKAIAAELHTNVAGVRQMASQGKITSDIYDKAFNNIAETVKGSSAKQAQTFNGMISTMKDDFSILMGVLEKPIFNALHDGMTKLLPVMDAFVSLGRGDFKSFSDTISQTFGSGTAKMINEFISGTREGFANGFGKMQTSIGTFGAFLGNAFYNMKNLSKYADDFIKGMKEGFVNGFGQMQTTVGTWGAYIGNAFYNIFNYLKDIGGYAFNDLAKFAQNAFTQIKDFWQKDGDKIMAAVKQAIQDVSAALEASKPVLKAVFDIITTVGIQAFNDLVGAIKWVGDNLNWLIPIAAGVVGGIAAFKIIETVITLMQAFTAVTKLLDLAWIALDIVLDANPIGLIALAIGALIAAGVALYNNWDTVKNKMQVIWMEIKAGAQDAINGVIDKINEMIGLINKIPGVNIPIVPKVNFDALSSVRAAPGSAPNGYGRAGGAMAAFASGTNYAPGGLALVGEEGPEIVDLPRGSKVYTNGETKQMLNSGGTSKTYNVTVNSLQASMDEKDLVRALQRMEALNYA